MVGLTSAGELGFEGSSRHFACVGLAERLHCKSRPLNNLRNCSPGFALGQRGLYMAHATAEIWRIFCSPLLPSRAYMLMSKSTVMGAAYSLTRLSVTSIRPGFLLSNFVGRPPPSNSRHKVRVPFPSNRAIPLIGPTSISPVPSTMFADHG